MRRGTYLLICLLFLATLSFWSVNKRLKDHYDLMLSVSDILKEGRQQLTGETDKPQFSSIEEWEAEQKRRMDRIAQVCSKYQDSEKPDIKPGQILFDQKHNLLYCPNAKVATSTFLVEFLKINNYTQEKIDSMANVLHKEVQGMLRLSNKPKDVIPKIVEDSISFTTARHPFVRLVSAYLDNLLEEENPDFTKLRNAIARQFGSSNFTSFARSIIEAESKTMGCRLPFICQVNEHWRPFNAKCFYCQIPYKVLIKQETFADDMHHLGRIAKVNFAMVRANRGGSNTREKAMELFSKLPESVFADLVKFYSADFEMFGYSPEEFAFGKKVDLSYKRL